MKLAPLLVMISKIPEKYLKNALDLSSEISFSKNAVVISHPDMTPLVYENGEWVPVNEVKSQTQVEMSFSSEA